MIYQCIYDLIEYSYSKELIEEEDKIYIRNSLLELFKLNDYPNHIISSISGNDLETILKFCLEYAYENGLIPENSVIYRDLFDTKIMGILTPRPSEVSKRFRDEYEISPYNATNYFYRLCQDIDYIRAYRVKKDLKWVIDTEYGDLDITINLSKPEKDPKEIAAIKDMPQTLYPKCQLCIENEGYSGRVNHPGRQNLRIIPLKLMGQDWGFQYSPYVYYNEHCIVLKNEHTPMKIDEKTFRLLLDFVKQFPHYFIGSNADLPIVGGSILSHNHFQGGNYEFAMSKAPIESYYTIKNYEDIEFGIVKWPMSVIRIRHVEAERLVEISSHILNIWRIYSDESADIYSKTGFEQHNTITPIARKKGDIFEMDIVLRNNITTPEFPLGLYHPHDDLHHIKKENIGLIEVMGLAVLPSRLNEEMQILKTAILTNESIEDNEKVKKHANWIKEVINKYPSISKDNIDEILKHEIGEVFLKVLEDAGVYKRTEVGKKAFERFIYSL